MKKARRVCRRQGFHREPIHQYTYPHAEAREYLRWKHAWNKSRESSSVTGSSSARDILTTGRCSYTDLPSAREDRQVRQSALQSDCYRLNGRVRITLLGADCAQ